MANNEKTVQAPSFQSTVIDSDRQDGYWVETFPFSTDDKVPGVITSGLNSGIVDFLDNPIAEAHHTGISPPDDPSGSE